jgi:hypothetical protein
VICQTPLCADSPAITFLPKPDFAQQAAARRIVRHAGGFNAVQPEAIEQERHQAGQRLGHDALAREGPADPVAEAGGLGHAAAHIAEIDAAKQRIVAAAEQQEGIAGIVMPFRRRLVHAPAIGGAG